MQYKITVRAEHFEVRAGAEAAPRRMSGKRNNSANSLSRFGERHGFEK